MALRARFPDRDEVIIPAYTSYSVPAAVVRAGLRVRLCDVEIESLGLSPKELEHVLTPWTFCIVPNHLYGIPCQIDAVCEIAHDHQVPVVEDAAQAMDVWCMGQLVASFGEAVIFSSPGTPPRVTKSISQQIMTLPTHPWVREADIQRIREVFRQCSE